MLTPDLPAFHRLMKGLGVLYSKPMHEPLLEIYWRALERFDFASVKTALHAHVGNPDTGQFLPKPADVVRYVEGNRATQGLRAWSFVEHAIQSIGGYRSVVFDDRLTHAVIEDMGGWITLCRTTLDELPFKANEFEKRYAAYVLHPPTTYPRQLRGILARDNQASGQPIAPPVLLGDVPRAEAVYARGGETALAYSPTTAASLAQHITASFSITPHTQENT
jgi:hypothetical protein